ncbi:hypothetical protein F4553_005320 [Allocatelliglobosispora scoriae]|uniref:Uncharacterized protein n=1 Tax=Allocatelliglobosispora scoriae TaxID=643052 RepID=A0A841BZ50_9ACTN|nr:hypothetical protein [Allocatelliglobosispora scoriae]MBB5871941.1 hypothetical protein [Allocatelliglobosispora scoriae]
MFLADPTLRLIAATTNDVLPEQLWRYDTGTEDAVGDLARILHKTALAYNASCAELDKPHPRPSSGLRAAGTGEAMSAVLATVDRHAACERHNVIAGGLLDLYQAWRRHRPINDGDERHLLLRPRDPGYGVATLQRTSHNVWMVTADPEAADAFEVPYPNRMVGVLYESPWEWWLPVACTDAAHLAAASGPVYRLPVRDDFVTACRSLLRWWALRHSAAWQSRTPDQLTPTELDQLAA